MGWPFDNTDPMPTLEFERKEKERQHAYLDEVKGIKLPGVFEETSVAKEKEENKRNLISYYDKRLVLLKDTHLCAGRFYFSGRIFYDPEDKQCYNFQRVNGEAKGQILQLHFHDLEGLLVPLIK